MVAGLDSKLTGPPFTTGSPPIPALRQRMQGIRPEIGGFEIVGCPAGKVWCSESNASCRQEAVTPAELQEVLWKQLFANPIQWWDNRRSKLAARHPDFKHKKSKVALWLHSRHKPAWVDSQLARLDAGLKTTRECRSTSVQGHGAFAANEGRLGIGKCRKLCEDGRIADAVDALDVLVQRGCHVTNNLFYCLLQGCIKHRDLVLGRRIHALTVKSGHEGDAFLATHLIGLYASHGRLGEALRVFTKVLIPDAYNWATIISVYARHGEAAEAAEAIRLYRQMCESTAVKPDDRIYSAVLKACAAAGDLIAGKEVHAHVLASPGKPDRFVQAGLVNMYAKCGSLEDARRLFDQLSERDVVTWTAMIAGYAQQGMGQEALGLYRIMQQEGLTAPNSVTYVCLLQACASGGVGALEEGKQLHAQIKERRLQEDVVLGGSLVNMYAKCGSLQNARRTFDRLAKRNVVAWNAMISGYAQKGVAEEALSLYRSMQQEGLTPDCVTYVCLLQACANEGLRAVHEGKQLHAQIRERGMQEDGVLGVSLVNFYAKCGSLRDARTLFDKLSEKNVTAWNAIIAGYAQHGMGKEALSLYSSMEQYGVTPDCVTYVCLLQAIASIGAGALDEGKQLHAKMKGLQMDVVAGGSLVNMYAKCGSLEDARSVFDKLPERTVVAWTAIISGYVFQGMGQEALILYRSMQQESLIPDCVTYVSLLQACASVGVAALEEGKHLHTQIKGEGLQEDTVLAVSLINMYAKCGSLEDARIVFDKLPERNVIAWTGIISAYAQLGKGQEALRLYRSMRQEGLTFPDSVTYVCLLQACSSVGAGALDEGKQLHAQLTDRGLQGDVVVGGSLVNMYAKCGSLEDARSLFDKLPVRNVVAWTAMLAGYVQLGMGQEALNLYNNMQQEGLTPPNSVTYVCLLQACASVGALDEGKQLHAQIEEQGLQEDVVLGSSLVNMYAKCGSLEDALIVFEKLLHKDVATWTAMISAYAQRGMGHEALGLYRNMEHEGVAPDFVTYVCLLQAIASVGVGALEEGKQLHAQIKERGLQEDVVVGGSLVNMYAKCCSLEDARGVFDKLSERNIVTCNAMLAGYAQQGMGEEALSLYSSMQQEGFTFPDSVTYICLLQACASIGVGALDEGKQLHAQIKERGLEEDVVLGGSLVNMYAKCGNLEDARTVFENLPERNIVAYNVMLAGYAQQGMGQDAFSLYRCMQQEGLTPDCVTYVSLLQACANVGVEARDEGKQLHAQIEERGLQDDVVLGGSLVNMYAKCGSLEDARRLFDTFAERNVVAWNTMIAGYAQHGISEEALDLYRSMQQDGLTSPNSFTYVCLLQACAAVAALPLGEQLHAEIEERGMEADVTVGAALVNMYAKCGSMYESQQVFDSLPERSVEAWGALVSGYSRQGDVDVVFGLLDRMRLEGIQPHGMLFLSVLTMCSHVGLVDKGQDFFESMWTDHGISPTVEHYRCMVDLLGRAGHLEEALQMAQTMPFPPNDVLWHALLGACRKWKNVEIGQQAFKGALSVDEKDAASYVLMSNIYASAEMWEAAKEMQSRRKKLGAWKKPGQSWWTDMGGVVHTFLVGDKKHPDSEGIYARLEQLVPKMKKEGYVPHLQSSLQDISDHEKEAELCGHSEKLAIAYALIKTAEGTTIRIVKNLRVCEDCHTATCYIAKVERRTIICRDGSRFHIFKDGQCSCGDYW